MKKSEQFLMEYEAMTQRLPHKWAYERSLHCLLEGNRDVVVELLDQNPKYFHKAFRQIDVTNVPGVDSAIWILIDCAHIFWDTFHEIWPMESSDGM